jgi:cell division septal protein FtsQ
MTTARPAARQIGHVRRRSSTVRRRSAGLSAVRAGALLAMLASAAAGWGLISSPVFGLDRVVISGASLTDEAAIRTSLGVELGTNLVTLDTAALAQKVEGLTTIRSAEVAAGLPGTLRVIVQERQPILAWAIGARRFLVDVDGRIIAALAPGDPLPRVDRDGRVLDPERAGRSTTAQPIALVDDVRRDRPIPHVGDRVDAIELDVARRLGSVRPADVGSSANGLVVRISDDRGFVVRPTEGPWFAVFGFYTPTLRSPAIVPGQVRLLRSLLANGESTFGIIVLASETDGTYLPPASPAPSPSPSP